MEKKHTKGKLFSSNDVVMVTLKDRNNPHITNTWHFANCHSPQARNDSTNGKEEANANAELIVTAVNAYYPMLEALKSISVNASINLDLHKEGQIQNLSKCVNMLLEIATKAIALAEKADEYKGKFNNNEEGRSMQASLQKVKEMVNAALVQEGLDEMRAQKENKK